MNFEEASRALQTLHSELCTSVRKEEGLWYGMASDYQDKYAFTSDYDKSFKRDYYEKATICREIAEHLEKLPLPSTPEEIASFVDAVKNDIRQCPRHWKVQKQLEMLLEKMEDIADCRR